MKKIIVIILCLTAAVLASHAQNGWLTPNNSYGTNMNGINIKRFFAIPTVCGHPLPPASNDSFLLKSAFAYDSCGHVLFIYDPSTKVFDTLRAASSGGFSPSDTTNKWVQNVFVSNDSLFKVKNGTVTYLGLFSAGGSMVYPSAGIALSTGSAWGTSITDNSANWNTVLNRVLYTDTALMLSPYLRKLEGQQKIDSLAAATGLQQVTDVSPSTNDSILISSKSVAFNSDIVYGSGNPIYTKAPDGISGFQNLYFLNTEQTSRIRQDGDLKKIEFDLVSVPSQLIDFYFDVWRANGSNFDRIYHVNIFSSLSAGYNLISLPAGITVQEGDFIGASYTANPGITTFFYSYLSSQTTGLYYRNTAPSSTTNYNWTASTAWGNYWDARVYVDAPQILGTGDSRMEGAPNKTLIETSTYDDFSNTIPYKVRTATGVTYQNMGLNGQTVYEIRSRLRKNVLDIHPTIALLNGGINDIASRTTVQIINDYKSILDSLTGNGIKVIVFLEAPYSAGTNAQNRRLDTLRTQVDSLTQFYSGVKTIRVVNSLGQFRVGGDAGNLWDFQTGMSFDGIHYNPAANQRLADSVVIKINELIAEPTTYGNGYIKYNGNTYSYPSTGGQLALKSEIPTVPTDYWKTGGNTGLGSGKYIGNLDVNPLTFIVGGSKSGYLNSTSQNTYWGVGAGIVDTSGFQNFGGGFNALATNGGGGRNTASGVNSLYNNKGDYNTANGFDALFSNTTGVYNTGLGHYAGFYNTTAGLQTFINNYDAGSYGNDTSRSPIYIQQIVDGGGINTGLSRLRLNATTFFKNDIYANNLPRSNNTTDSMLVLNTSNGKVGYRTIPTGGGATDTLLIKSLIHDSLTATAFVVSNNWQGFKPLFFPSADSVMGKGFIAGWGGHYDSTARTITYTVDTTHNSTGVATWSETQRLVAGAAATTTTDNQFQISSNVLTAKKAYAALTSGTSITWDMSTSYSKTLTIAHNATLSITNIQGGDYGTLIITQDGTGGRTLSVPTLGAITINSAAGSETIISFTYDGTNYHWQTNTTITPRTYLTSIVTGTDANITASAGVGYRLPASTLTTGRNFNIAALNVAGDYLEIYNTEAGFNWTVTGASLYLSDGTTTVTTLLANTNYIIRYDGNKIKIIN